MLPAYNATETLKRTVDVLDRDVIDDVLLVDDASTDDTIQQAEQLGIVSIRHDQNRGYGANQKSCYKAALAAGLTSSSWSIPTTSTPPARTGTGGDDRLRRVRLRPRLTYPCPELDGAGHARLQVRRQPLPHLVQNVVLHQKLSEYHTGLRAYSRGLLEALPFERNSDDFVFDNQMIAQAVAYGASIGELSCPPATPETRPRSTSGAASATA